MSDVKISSEISVTSLTGTEYLPVVQAGANYKATPENIKNYLLALANTFTATQTHTPAANTSALVASGYSLTGSDAHSLIDLSGTWNTSGTPTALKLNVTDTASNASSLLLDLQVGGSSKSYVRKDGRMFVAGLIFTSGGLWMNTDNNSYLAMGATQDTWLWRDAAGILAQRNSTNAQAFRVYNTYTDASNYERGVFDWSTDANKLTIGTQKAGTGSNRAVQVVSAADLALQSTNGGNINLIGNTNNNLVVAYNQVKIGSGTSYSLGGSDATNFLSISQTWNTTGTPTLILANVTDTASNAASLFADFQVGGTSKAAIHKSGAIRTLSTTVASLPTAANAGAGARAFVTDATATTFLSTVAGGGANKVPVVSDGTNWLIG